MKVGRKLENKMVPTFLEESLGFKEVIHLKKHQGFLSRVGKSDPPAGQQCCGAVPRTPAFFPIPIKPRPSKNSTSTPSTKAPSVTHGFLVLVSRCPGMEDKEWGRTLAGRLKLTQGSPWGPPRNRYSPTIPTLYRRALIFFLPSSPHFNPKS